MTSLTLPRRCLWGNLHGLCEAPWDHLRPPVFFSPRSSFQAAWFESIRNRWRSATSWAPSPRDACAALCSMSSCLPEACGGRTPWGLGGRRLCSARTGDDPQRYALTTACTQRTCLASHRDIRPQTCCQHETEKSVRMAIVTWQSAFGWRAPPIPMVWHRV